MACALARTESQQGCLPFLANSRDLDNSEHINPPATVVSQESTRFAHKRKKKEKKKINSLQPTTSSPPWHQFHALTKGC